MTTPPRVSNPQGGDSPPRLILQTDCRRLTLERRPKPGWAQAMGRDRYGLWADLVIEPAKKSAQEVRQRLRWIPPGDFLMGSPEGEPGRSDREGPQHEVLIENGFWLFDTPVTQAMWLALVGGENPSRFQSPSRPVERVSWEECRGFFAALTSRFTDRGEEPGNWQWNLPTEAQWEYACRAGTQTATYAGPLEILGEHNAPALDAIAWYSGNSGKDFDLEKGENSSSWPNKQYDHKKAGSREVAGKAPNPWGLYDTLGNVLEWCRDGQRTYKAEPATDPMGAPDGPRRVFRGRSWIDVARYCRAADRDTDAPSNRYNTLGFRCAQVQVPAGAEPAPAADDRAPERRSPRPGRGGAGARKK